MTASATNNGETDEERRFKRKCVEDTTDESASKSSKLSTSLFNENPPPCSSRSNPRQEMIDLPEGNHDVVDQSNPSITAIENQRNDQEKIQQKEVHPEVVFGPTNSTTLDVNDDELSNQTSNHEGNETATGESTSALVSNDKTVNQTQIPDGNDESQTNTSTFNAEPSINFDQEADSTIDKKVNEVIITRPTNNGETVAEELEYLQDDVDSYEEQRFKRKCVEDTTNESASKCIKVSTSLFNENQQPCSSRSNPGEEMIDLPNQSITKIENHGNDQEKIRQKEVNPEVVLGSTNSTTSDVLNDDELSNLNSNLEGVNETTTEKSTSALVSNENYSNDKTGNLVQNTVRSDGSQTITSTFNADLSTNLQQEADSTINKKINEVEIPNGIQPSTSSRSNDEPKINENQDAAVPEKPAIESKEILQREEKLIVVDEVDQSDNEITQEVDQSDDEITQDERKSEPESTSHDASRINLKKDPPSTSRSNDPKPIESPQDLIPNSTVSQHYPKSCNIIFFKL